MKKYKVRGFCALMDVEINTDDAKYASDLFEAMMDSDCYDCGYVVDNYTGEAYANFDKEIEGNGMKTTYWTALS